MIWDPYEAAAEASTGARILTDGTGLVDNHQFYFSSKTFLADNGKAVDAVLDALNEADDWSKNHIDEVATQLSPSVGLPAPVLADLAEARGLSASPGHRRGDRQPAAHRRHLRRARPAAESDHRVRSSAQIRIMTMSSPKPSKANILWFLPTHGDGRYLGTTEAAATVDLRLSDARSRRRPTSSAIIGVLLPTGRSLRGFLGRRLGRWRR